MVNNIARCRCGNCVRHYHVLTEQVKKELNRHCMICKGKLELKESNRILFLDTSNYGKKT